MQNFYFRFGIRIDFKIWFIFLNCVPFHNKVYSCNYSVKCLLYIDHSFSQGRIATANLNNQPRHKKLAIF